MSVVLGSGEHRYRVVENWAKLPDGWNLTDVAAVGVDSKDRVSLVTSAGSGPSLGKYILLSYLPPEHAVVGTKLQVYYMNEYYPVEVAVAGSMPVYDPTDARMKA